MNRPVEQLIAAYLDGELDGDQAARLEERLGEPETAAALAYELGVREWLTNLGPHEAPAALVAELQRAVAHAPAAEAPTAEAVPSALRAALGGMSWMARGPALAVTASGVPSVPGYGATGAAQGFSAVGRALPQLPAGLVPREKKPVSWSRRVGGWAWKLVRRK